MSLDQALLPPPADVLMSDGRLAVIRRLASDDGPALHDLHDQVSDEALRLRFFSASRRAAHQYVDQILAEPGALALVAEVDGRLVALATAEPSGPGVLEIALLVADGQHDRGLGTLLLEHLAALARDRGIRRFEAQILVENAAMLAVLEHASYDAERLHDKGVVVVELSTVSTPEVQEAADLREFAAEARSLRALLAPRSVAIAGVRSDGSGVGAAVLRSIVRGGFGGDLLVVHPHRATVGGVAAAPSFVTLPGPVDLAVIAVPAQAAEASLLDAAEGGVRAAVVLSAGFGELGDEGLVLQRRLSALARTRGIRLVGPNCLGVVVNEPEFRLDATFSARPAPGPGALAVASQSGGVGIVLLDRAHDLGLGLHAFVSLGNTADVSSNDLLAAWYDDPAVRVGALYLESFGNARKFARFARRFSERKPLLAVVGGRSGAGQRAGASHTAAAASSDVAVRALFAQSGVIPCEDADDLAESALLLVEQPLPRGPRLGVLSNAGGVGILVADAAERHGLTVPELSPEVRSVVASLVDGTSGTGNPVDAGAAAAPDQLAGVLDVLLGSGEVDAVIAVVVGTGVTDGVAAVRRLAEVRAGHPQLPVVVVPLGGLEVGDLPGVTTYATTGSAVRSLARAAGYARWRTVPNVAVTPSDPVAASAARSWCRAALGDEADRWLEVSEAKQLLDDYGIRLVGEVVTGSGPAVAAAGRAGYPVAVKAAAAGALHKTEHRLVRTGLESAEEVCRAVEQIGSDRPVLVQPMMVGVEVALGTVRDPGLGPLVMVAAGGVATDVWADRAFLVPPVSTADAGRALRALRSWPLLDGFRGAPRADAEGLVDLIVGLGRLAVDVPELAELDLNPVLADGQGCSVVDVRLRLARTSDPAADAPTQLRRTP